MGDPSSSTSRVQRGFHTWIRLGMSPGQQWVLMSILVGTLMGNVTHRSRSPTDMALWGSVCGFCGSGYLPWVPAVYSPLFLILLKCTDYTFQWFWGNCSVAECGSGVWTKCGFGSNLAQPPSFGLLCWCNSCQPTQYEPLPSLRDVG
jgi:hypothetical protein